MPSRNGLVSLSVLAMVLAGAFSGALVGLILAGVLTSQGLLAIATAIVAVLLALVVGRVILRPHAPLALGSAVVLWNVIVASVIGALAGHELSVDLRSPPASPLIGAMSGLLASLLIATFAINLWLKDRQPAD